MHCTWHIQPWISQKNQNPLYQFWEISLILKKNEQISIEKLHKNIRKWNKKILLNFLLQAMNLFFLKSIIGSTLKLSATSVQNFLDVTSGGPRYFLTRNLLQFPQAKSENATYGSAIHKGLEDFFKDYKFKKTFNKEILFNSLRNI